MLRTIILCCTHPSTTSVKLTKTKFIYQLEEVFECRLRGKN